MYPSSGVRRRKATKAFNNATEIGFEDEDDEEEDETEEEENEFFKVVETVDDSWSIPLLECCNSSDSSSSSINWKTEQHVMDEFPREFVKILSAVEKNSKDARNVVLGFIVLHVVKGEETQIVEIAVRPNMRRKKIATRLLQTASNIDPDNEMHLEVSEKNTATLALYENFGFVKELQRRKNYYKDGSDAILMSLEPLLLRKKSFISTREVVRRLAGLPEDIARIPAPLDPNDRSDVDSMTKHLPVSEKVEHKREVPFRRDGKNTFSLRRKRRGSILDD